MRAQNIYYGIRMPGVDILMINTPIWLKIAIYLAMVVTISDEDEVAKPVDRFINYIYDKHANSNTIIIRAFMIYSATR